MRCLQISNGVELKASIRPKGVPVLSQLNSAPCGTRFIPFECRCARLWRRRKSLKARCVPDISEESIIRSEPTSQLQGVIFDLDGVLCDSEEICRKCAAETFFQLYKTKVPESAFFPYQGMGDKVYFESVAEDYGIESFNLEQVKDAFFDTYSKELGNKDISYPGLDTSRLARYAECCVYALGAIDLIVACKSAGFKIAVASSAERNKVLANLTSIGADISLFDSIVSGDMITKLKPNPDIFLKAAEMMGIDPRSCLVIEDSLPGVRASVSAGMVSVAVKTTVDKAKLQEAGADAVFNTVSDISITDLLKAFHDALNSKQGVQDQPKISESRVPGTSIIQDFLNTPVGLPAGYKTDRRSILQLMNFGLGSTCIYILASRSKTMSFLTPQSLASAMTTPFGGGRLTDSNDSSRVQAFKRYISEVESKGGGTLTKGFPKGADWFNSPPLSLDRDLRGKLVLLDFWTYCCINCMHVLPDLAYIEKKFSDQPVTVVGVHSAKFDNEKDSGAIRNAVLRYDIGHPVVNDRNMFMWKDIGVNSWPTLVLLSPEGKVLLTLPGEGHRQDLDDIVTAGLDYYGRRDLLSDKAVPMALEKLKDNKLIDSSLRFPGKVASDLVKNRLFISDSNNHRIVITTLEGDFIEDIGGNGAKLQDGDYNVCCFNRPQGCCYDPQEDVLYVADTENHALRKVDLQRKSVETVAGNGYQGRDYKGGGKGKYQQLSSPWDVEMKDRDVFIAMAGQHQIWKYNTDSKISAFFSGNGYERNKNGSNGRSTSWAQPSGLSLVPGDSNWMFVADSESSSVRRLNTQTAGSEGVAGGDSFIAENLFRFGDVDGKLSQTLFQHPLSVLAIDKNTVFVADSYNHKLRMVDMEKGICRTVGGRGSAGYSDGPSGRSQLSEPSGVASGPNNTLFIADTNNNLIRVFFIEEERLATLNLERIPKPRVSPLEVEDALDVSVPSRVIVTEEANTVQGTVNVNFSFEKGFGFTKGAVSSFVSRLVGVSKGNNSEVTPTKGAIETKKSPNVQLQYSIEGQPQPGMKLQADCKVYYCEEGQECLVQDIRIEIPFGKVTASGKSTVNVTVDAIGNT